MTKTPIFQQKLELLLTFWEFLFLLSVTHNIEDGLKFVSLTAWLCDCDTFNKFVWCTRGTQKKSRIHNVVFLHLRSQKASPLPILPISEIITKLSKTLITLLLVSAMLYPSHYEIGVKLVFVWLGHCQNHTHQLKNHASIFHQSYSITFLERSLSSIIVP